MSENSQPNIQLDTYNDMTVGQILSLARQQAGYSLPQIADILRIRAIYLEAIEKDDMASLPGRVYAIGFVRAYAEYLNLDGDKIVHILKSQLLGHTSRQQLNFPVAASESKLPPIWVIGASLAGFFLVFLAWTLLADPQSKVADIPDVPQELKTEIDTEEASIEEAKQEEQEKIEVEPPIKMISKGVQLKMIERTWLSIKDAAGKVVVSRVMKEGEAFEVPEGKEFVLDTGNAGGIDVWIGEENIGALGVRGGIERNVVLTPENLKSILNPADESP